MHARQKKIEILENQNFLNFEILLSYMIEIACGVDMAV